MGRVLLSAVLVLSAPLGSSPVAAQEPEYPTFTESAGSEYVMLPVQVFDRKGRFVSDLAKKDFQVRVHETSVVVDTFEKDENAPVSFAFLVDLSGSMQTANKLENAKKAIRQIIQNRRSGDDFALFTFADAEVRVETDFSKDPRPLLEALGELEASGQTALFDAVAATPGMMTKGKNNKRAILLFTDGVDNASKLSAVEMAEILQKVSTPVYTIGMKNAALDRLTEEQRSELFLDNLNLLASSSGGRMYLVAGDADLRPVAAKVDIEVRKQYLLGFAPSGQGEVRYRVVIVTVAKPGRWTVRTRRGYRGTAPTPAATTTSSRQGA